MRKAGNILLLLLLLTLVLPACKKDAKTAVATGVDAKVMPTMMTRDVKTLISDSGMTRYRITSKLWLVYDEVKDRIQHLIDVSYSYDQMKIVAAMKDLVPEFISKNSCFEALDKKEE